MRVAEIAPPWLPVPPRGYGGIELVVDLLSRGLEQAGHDVTLFASAGSESTAEVVTPLPPVGLDQIGAALPEAHHVVAAYEHAGEFDVIHAHTPVGPAVGAFLSDSPPVVHTLHGAWDDSTRGYYALLDPRIHLVAISDTQRRLNP